MITAGIDIGSLSTDVVILKEGAVAGHAIVPTGSGGPQVARRALRQALQAGGIDGDDIHYIVATGYGRVSLDFAHRKVTEIACHARGAHRLVPSVLTVIDIGGQDSKVIRITPEGRVADFVMNDKCAAGTGRFLEVMARALEVEVERLGDISAGASAGAAISSMCTVFAESEVVSLVAGGRPVEEIVRGLHEAVAERIAAMAHRVGLEAPVMMTGGVAKNSGVVTSLQSRLGVEIIVPPEPQIVGALGAAVMVAEFYKGKS